MRNTINIHHLNNLLICFLLHHLIFNAAANSPSPYILHDNIALACGSNSEARGMDGRTWAVDNYTKISLVDQNNASITLESPSTVNNAPYRTVRLSRSQFSYTFPVTAGQKFIRLHFYSISYSDYRGSNAIFSVESKGFTLLRNFSASLHAQSFGLERFVKEFCLIVEGGQLNITFIPITGMADAYAFINGIEIVSIPTNLYYSAEGDIDKMITFVDQLNPLVLENNTALELKYRINVGGDSISPQDDTGMFRSWSSDDDYLTVADSNIIAVNESIELHFTKIYNYTAPKAVYQSARSIRPTINQLYNLTWEFQVDSPFIYFVRLHFCEIQPQITRVNERAFKIYMNNQTADSQADVIGWSGGNGVPVYRDFAVLMGGKGNQKFQNLSVALRPCQYCFSVYYDAILNGIEIFRLIDSEIHIASMSKKSSKPKHNRIKIVAIVGGAVLAFFVLSLLLILFIVRRRLKRNDCSRESIKFHRSSIPSNFCRSFSLSEIKAATNNFDKLCIIGVGGFGNVYKGIINDEVTTSTIAVKRLSPGSDQGANEFKTEIEMLSQLRHPHLVSLIGYCNSKQEMILVYDYMAHGSFRDHLYNTGNPPLSWNQRLEICLGAAQGLQYLHSGTKHAIIHRDVKSTNILLDENWVAKVSDFGLSKMRTAHNSKSHITTVVKGSYGYLDPEYYRRQQLTEKSDVYSFGVVLFEALCARPAVNQITEDDGDYDEQVSLAIWARKCYSNGTLNQIIDPYLKGKTAPECFKIFREIAVSCLFDERMKRPSMSDVVSGLELALQLQKSAEDNLKLSGSNLEIIDFDLDINVSADVLSLLKIRTSMIDESFSKISIDNSYNSDIVEMTFLGAAEKQEE